ncbi:hypothetical protein ACFFRR_011829 [Megaselia abdita]
MKCSSNVINVVHLKSQSLFAHIDDFRSDLVSRSVDIALISETWLNSSHPDGMISVGGYNHIRNGRPHIIRTAKMNYYARKLDPQRSTKNWEQLRSIGVNEKPQQSYLSTSTMYVQYAMRSMKSNAVGLDGVSLKFVNIINFTIN